MRLIKLEKIVKETLESNIETRSNDHLLYIEVILKIRPEISTCNFKHVFENYYDYKLPPFESVRICRRTLQRKNINLISDNAYIVRKRKIKEYVDYAIETGGID